MRGDVLIQRDLVCAMPPPPEPVAVACLIDGDAIDPRSQARLATEAVDRAEDAEEHVLREVQGFVAIAQEVDSQLNHHPLVFANELSAGEFVADCATLHKRRLAAADIRPTDNSRVFHREFHYTNFRPRAGPKVPTGW